MRRSLLKVMVGTISVALLFILPSLDAQSVDSISGAGATFPYPVYSTHGAACCGPF